MRTEDKEQLRIVTERDYRNYQWKMKRQRQVRFYVLGMVLAAVLLAGIIFSFRVLVTRAQDEEISYKYYASIQVSYGESLWSIAETYQDEHYDCIQDYMDEVIHINHLRNEDDLTAGQYLIVPYYSSEYIK